MTAQLVVPNAAALDEFQGFTGDCVETSVLAVEHVMTGVPMTPASLNAMVRRWQAWGPSSAGGAGPQGQANTAAVMRELDAAGIPADNYDSSQYDWRPILRQYAGTRPIVVGLSNAQALGGWNAGVHGHAVTVMGQDAGGYLVMDPNSQAAADGQLVHYTEKQLSDAHVDGVIVPRSTPMGGPLQSAPIQALLAALLGASYPAAAGVAGAAQQQEQQALTALQDLLLRGFLISVGIVLVIVAVIIFAKPSMPPVEDIAALAAL